MNAAEHNSPSKHLKTQWIRILIYVLLLLLFIAAVQDKNYQYSTREVYRLPDDAGAFWTEAAFHYRHARMVKEGIGLPSLDKQIQYPEGIEVWKYCTPVMDWFYGTLYRAGLDFGLSFQRFVVEAQHVWSTLSLFAIFLGGLALWRNHWGALLAAAFYAFSLGHMDRSSLYLRENFALPLLWLHLALLLMAARSKTKSKNIWLSLGSSSFLILAFASWHVSRFYFLLLIGGLIVTQLPLRGKSIIKEEHFQNIRRTLLIMTVANILAGLLLPMLKVTHFLYDPAMMMSYALLLSYYLLPRMSRLKGRTFFLVSIVILAIFFSTSYALQRAEGSYSHVEELLKAKIHFLGILPEDPSLLSFEARAMWNGPFKSPSLEYFLLVALPGILLLGLVVVMMVKDWRQDKGNRLAVLIAFLALLSIMGFMLVLRAHVLMHIPIAMLATRMGFSKLKKYQIAGILVLAGFIVAHVFLLMSSRITVMQPSAAILRSLTHYIQQETSEDAVFACEFNLGPTVACDADRAVLLQSKFENRTIRKKVQELYEAIFEDEETLLKVCQKYGATHFILGADTVLNTSKESMRYLSGKRNITKKMVAYQMHFDESQLQHFQIVFQNVQYRIFQIGDETAPPLPPDQYWPIWDAKVLGLDQVRSSLVPDMALEQALSTGSNVFAWLKAAEELKITGRTAEAESLLLRSISPAISSFERVIPLQPPDLATVAELVARGSEEAARLLNSMGQNREASQLLYRAARPFTFMGRPQQSLRMLDKALMYDPDNQLIMKTREQLIERMQNP